MSELVGPDGREKKRHGTPDFPCSVCICPQETGFPWHWHDEWEIIWVQQGPVEVAAANRRYTLQAGDVLFLNGRTPHAVMMQGGKPYSETDLEFHPRLLYGTQDSVFWEKYLRPFQQCDGLSAVPLTPKTPWQTEAAEQCRRACRACLQKADGYEFEVRQALTQVFLLIRTNLKDRLDAAAPRLQAAAHVRMMKEYLDAHYAQPLTLRQMADIAHLSPRSCQRAFQQFLGLSPMQYLRQKRLQCAASMLSAGQGDITQICYACGFADPSAFSRQFRAYYGTAPSRWKQTRSL